MSRSLTPNTSSSSSKFFPIPRASSPCSLLLPSHASLASHPQYRALLRPQDDLHAERYQKSVQLLTKWERIAELYTTVDPEDDEEVDVMTGEIIYKGKKIDRLEPEAPWERDPFVLAAWRGDVDRRDEETASVITTTTTRSNDPLEGNCDKVKGNAFYVGDGDWDTLDFWGDDSQMDIQVDHLPKVWKAQTRPWSKDDQDELEAFLKAESQRRKWHGDAGVEDDAVEQTTVVDSAVLNVIKETNTEDDFDILGDWSGTQNVIKPVNPPSPPPPTPPPCYHSSVGHQPMVPPEQAGESPSKKQKTLTGSFMLPQPPFDFNFCPTSTPQMTSTPKRTTPTFKPRYGQPPLSSSHSVQLCSDDLREDDTSLCLSERSLSGSISPYLRPNVAEAGPSRATPVLTTETRVERPKKPNKATPKPSSSLLRTACQLNLEDPFIESNDSSIIPSTLPIESSATSPLIPPPSIQHVGKTSNPLAHVASKPTPPVDHPKWQLAYVDMPPIPADHQPHPPSRALTTPKLTFTADAQRRSSTDEVDPQSRAVSSRRSYAPRHVHDLAGGGQAVNMAHASSPRRRSKRLSSGPAPPDFSSTISRGSTTCNGVSPHSKNKSRAAGASRSNPTDLDTPPLSDPQQRPCPRSPSLTKKTSSTTPGLTPDKSSPPALSPSLLPLPPPPIPSPTLETRVRQESPEVASPPIPDAEAVQWLKYDPDHDTSLDDPLLQNTLDKTLDDLNEVDGEHQDGDGQRQTLCGIVQPPRMGILLPRLPMGSKGSTVENPIMVNDDIDELSGWEIDGW